MLLTSPLTLISLAASLGLLLGKIHIKRFSLGSSGALFTGLFLGWLVITTLPPDEQNTILSQGLVGQDVFKLSLALFIGAVALSSARYLNRVIRTYGIKLLSLGIIVPLTGALTAFALSKWMGSIQSAAIPGAFSGALTSSPGLAAALEHVQGSEAEAAVGFGYAVGYIPGVLAVVLAMQGLPLLFRLDAKAENKAYCEDLDIDETAIPQAQGFRPLEFFLVIVLGTLLGALQIPLGPLGHLGLGVTGGILTIGLLLGFVGKLGPLNFQMSTAALSTIRELGVVLFLSVVGLRYGHNAIDAIHGAGLPLLVVATASALSSIAVGFFVGRYLLKLNWILLAGALCGAMTSTPGLGAAVESTGCDDVASGYGAVYPVALLSMVIFTILLSSL
ncbi:MAG: hypothetical protein MI717_08900 [Spirochaetales bacterium]|nr:hypothetical protein [Spirochaetales bacterium]